MKCSKCGGQNPDEAKFCRVCGANFSPQTVVERYPEYNFIPTSIMSIRHNYTGWFVLIFIMLPVFFFAGGGGFVFYEECFRESAFVEDYPEFYGVCFIAIIEISLIIAIYNICTPIRFFKAKEQLIKKADYIQNYSSLKEHYVFILKDDKFGLFNVKRRRVHFTPMYNSLSWKVKNKILYAEKDGQSYTIDIYGNKLK